MTGQTADHLAEKLKELMTQVPEGQRSEMLVRAGQMDVRMRDQGQLRPTWRGPIPEMDVLGREVVVPSDHGERVGKVVFFGVHQDGALFERSVFVLVPASGTVHEAPGSSVRIAGTDDIGRMGREVEMARRLASVDPVAEPAKPRRQKAARDPAMTARLIETARDAGMAVTELKTFYRIEGTARGRALYLSTVALKADLSGFCVDHPAVRPVSEEEAKAGHLGAVRGQLDFSDRDAAEEAFLLALGGLI